jgi:type I restriction enzyme S subunit
MAETTLERGPATTNERLPEGWAYTLMDAAGKWLTGGTPSRKVREYFDGGIPWVKSGDLTDGYVERTEETISAAGLANSAAKLLPPGTLSIALYGATIGKLGILDMSAATNQACANCVVNPAVAINKFLFYYLRQQRQAFIEAGQGGAQPNLTNQIVREWPLLLPPLHEQERIIACADDLFAHIKSARAHLFRVPALLKRFRQALLAAACSGRLTEDWRSTNQDEQGARDCLATSLERRKKMWQACEAEKNGRKTGSSKVQRRTKQYDAPFEPDLAMLTDDIPSTWVPATISQLAILDVGFAFPSLEFRNSGIRLLRGENVEPGSLRWLDVKCWPRDQAAEFEHLMVQDGESILAMDRPVVSSGLKLARATAQDVPCVLVQRVMRFKVPFPQVADFLHLRLQTSDFLRHVSGGLTGSDLPHITGTNVAEYTFGLPPLAEQQEIGRRVSALMAIADAIGKRVEVASAKAEQLTQSILAKAFRGELVSTEAELARREGREYEPASVLLERIKKQRDSQTSSKPERKRTRPRTTLVSAKG